MSASERLISAPEQDLSLIWNPELREVDWKGGGDTGCSGSVYGGSLEVWSVFCLVRVLSVQAGRCQCYNGSYCGERSILEKKKVVFFLVVAMEVKGSFLPEPLEKINIVSLLSTFSL